MADWIDTQFPHWLAARVQERDPTQAVMAAMQFGANQRQRSFDNALKLKELGVQEQSRLLQNRLLEMRIENDSADAATLAEWLPKFNAAQGDDLRNLPLPALKDVGRLDGIQRLITGRIAADANTTAGRIAATTRDSFLKEVETLDPQWRGDALSYLDDNQGVPTNDAWDYVNYAKEQSRARAEEERLRMEEAKSELIRKRQVEVAEIRTKAIEARIKGEPSLEQALMRHTNTVMSREGLTYSEAQDAIRAKWNQLHATETGAPAEAPITRKISAADEVRLKDIDEDEKNLKTRINKIGDDLATGTIDPDSKAGKAAKSRQDDLQSQLNNLGYKKTNILQKYEPAEPRPGLGELRKADEERTINQAGVLVRSKETGKIFRYKGRREDIPLDAYDVLE